MEYQCVKLRPKLMMTSSNGNIFRVTGPLSPVNSPHKGQWRGALMFSLVCAWINDWVNHHKTGDLRRHRANYDVIVMWKNHGITSSWFYHLLHNVYENVLHIMSIGHARPHEQDKCICILTYGPLDMLWKKNSFGGWRNRVTGWRGRRGLKKYLSLGFHGGHSVTLHKLQTPRQGGYPIVPFHNYFFL